VLFGKILMLIDIFSNLAALKNGHGSLFNVFFRFAGIDDLLFHYDTLLQGFYGLIQ